MQSDSVVELIERSKNNDYEAFRQLVNFYQPKIYAFAFRLLCDEEDANDAVQETFIKLWQHLAKYKPQFKFTTWLYTIAAHCCYDHLRVRKKRKSSSPDEIKSFYNTFSTINIEESIENRNLFAIVNSLTKKLTPKQRLIFTLKELEGLNMEEISSITQLSAEKIKSNLYLARKNIREQLNKIINNEQ